MNILNFIASSSYIVVNKDLIKLLGLEEAIILGELASEYDYYLKKEQLEDDWFYSTIENIEEKTGISEFKQRKAINTLKNNNIIDVRLKGIPAKRYIKIFQDSVLKLLNSQFLKNSRTSSEEIKEQVPEKSKGNKIYNKIYNNINSSNETEKENIFEFIETNFGRMLSPIELEIVNEWEDNELTRYAIKQAVLNRALNIKYIDKILFSYKKNNIQSIIQAQEEEEKFKNKKPTYKNYKKVDNKELPEWTKEETQKEELTGDELEELKKMWEEYK